VNSIGKEAIVRARQAEMFAQRRPFVVAPSPLARPRRGAGGWRSLMAAKWRSREAVLVLK